MFSRCYRFTGTVPEGAVLRGYFHGERPIPHMHGGFGAACVSRARPREGYQHRGMSFFRSWEVPAAEATLWQLGDIRRNPAYLTSLLNNLAAECRPTSIAAVHESASAQSDPSRA
jgi:hypothetical protein